MKDVNYCARSRSLSHMYLVCILKMLWGIYIFLSKCRVPGRGQAKPIFQRNYESYAEKMYIFSLRYFIAGLWHFVMYKTSNFILEAWTIIFKSLPFYIINRLLFIEKRLLKNKLLRKVCVLFSPAFTLLYSVFQKFEIHRSNGIKVWRAIPITL